MRKEKVIIYGGGQLGRLLIELLDSKKVQVIAIIDEYINIASYQKIPIYKLSKIPSSIKNFKIIVCVFKFGNPDTIENKLKSIGFSQVLDAYTYLLSRAETCFHNGWRLKSKSFKVKKLIKKISNNIQCQKSKEIFDINYLFRTGQTKNVLFEGKLIKESEKYCCNYVEYFIKNNSPEIIIDIGSWSFELAKQIELFKYKFENYIAIDPHPYSLNQYDNNSKLLKKVSSEMKFVQSAATGSQECFKKRYFKYDMGMASRLVNSSKPSAKPVSTICVSKYINPEKNHLVKIHIEGAEWEVLKEIFPHFSLGTKTMLLINCSHNSQGLIQIPLFLIEKGWDIRFNQHSFHGEGLTLYASNTPLSS